MSLSVGLSVGNYLTSIVSPNHETIHWTAIVKALSAGDRRRQGYCMPAEDKAN